MQTSFIFTLTAISHTCNQIIEEIFVYEYIDTGPQGQRLQIPSELPPVSSLLVIVVII